MFTSTVSFYRTFDNQITQTLGAKVGMFTLLGISSANLILIYNYEKKYYTQYSAAEAVGLTKEEAARMTTGQALLTIIARKREKEKLQAKKQEPLVKFSYKDGKIQKKIYTPQMLKKKTSLLKNKNRLFNFTKEAYTPRPAYYENSYEPPQPRIRAPKNIYKRYGRNQISYAEFLASVQREQESVSIFPHLQLPTNPLTDGTIEIPKKKNKNKKKQQKYLREEGIHKRLFMLKFPHRYIDYKPWKPPFWFRIPRKIKKRVSKNRYQLNKVTYNPNAFLVDKPSKAAISEYNPNLNEISNGQFKMRGLMVYFRKRVKFFKTNLQKITKKRKRFLTTAEARLFFGRKMPRRSGLFVRYVNSPKGIGYYKTMLRIFRRKNLKFFLRYKTVIVPLLRKRFKIEKKSLRFGKKQKRYKKFHQLRNAVAVVGRNNRLQFKFRQYKFFLFLQQGLRFVYGKFSRKDLKDIYLNAKATTKTDQFATFYFNFYRNLSMSLVLTSFLPKLISAKQFIRNKFVVVNGQICQNYIRFLNVRDIVELHRFMFLLLFIRGKNADVHKGSLSRPVIYMPFFVKNYRLLMFIFARAFTKNDKYLLSLRMKPINMLDKKKAFAFFFKSFIRFFPL